MNELQELKQNTNIIDVVSRFVSLKKEGIHEVGICPFHNDTHGSLKVTPSKQIFKCFSCDAGGDVFDFLTEMGNTIPEAISIIKNDSLISAQPTPIVLDKPENKWNYTSELPQSDPTFHHFKHGQPSNIYTYHDENHQIISYVCRFDFPDGSKQTLPYSPVTDGSVVKWGWKGLPAPKSLYNLHLIKQNPKSTIILVEGEKSADAGNNATESFIFVTWQGGAKGIRHSNFKPLHGRKVILWPDNDYLQKDDNGVVKPFELQPGNNAMLNIADIIGKSCSLLKWVKNADELPNKWDCADKEWQPKEIDKHIRLNLVGVPKKSVEQIPEPKSTIEPKPQNHQETEYYRLLGYSKDADSKLAYYFFSFGSKTVVRLTPTSMNKSNLIMLAPINYWESNFPGAKGLDITAVQNQLIQLSHNIGPFRDSFIRGRGAWMDDDKLIIHTGENIIIDGKQIPLADFDSRYVYEINEDIHFGYKSQLTDNEGQYILDSFDFPIWERQINSYLLAGWCVISPMCGVLDWRPHIWITGPAGSSKSWIMENLVLRLLGDIGVQIQGKSTSAGVSGLLQSDARPVLYDEADVDDARDKERIQSILALARASSSKTGGKVAKGTQTGGSVLTDPRSCFALSSIGVQLTQQADKTRFTIMSLMRFEGIKSTDEFNSFSNVWFETVTPKFVSRLQARTLELMPTIIKNANVFANAVSEHINSRRLGDQVGILLAGAYSLTSNKLVTFDAALKFVKSKDWSEEQSMETTKDEIQLLNVIMSGTVRVDGGFERSIGELVMIADCSIKDTSVLVDKAEDSLRRAGIILLDDRILISNNSEVLKNIVRNTSWSNDYGKLLKRIDGAESVSSRVYSSGTTSQRGTSIPMSLISNGKEKIMPDNEYLSNIKAPF